MRGQLPASLFAIVFGALETAGGAQELVYRGILNSQTEPLIVGTLGALTGVLLLAAGILLLIRSLHAVDVLKSAAYLAVPVYLFIGVYKHYAGWTVTLVGIGYPLLLLSFISKFAKSVQPSPRT